MNESTRRSSQWFLTRYTSYLIAEYVSAQSSYRSIEELLHYSISFFTHRLSRLIYNRELQKNHLFWWLFSSCRFLEEFLHIDLTSAFLLDSIEMTWRITMIVIFASSRLEIRSSWLQRSSQSRYQIDTRQTDDCFNFSLSDLLIESSEQVVRSRRRSLAVETIIDDEVAHRACWDFDDIVIKILCEHVTLHKSFWREVRSIALFWASIFTRTI